MAQQIQLRKDTAANWVSSNPTLAQAEVGVEVDTGKVKIGDGATAWTSLPYSRGETVDMRVIDGWFTKKKAGYTTLTALEVGDFIFGWIGTTFVAGRINSLPLASTSNIDIATSGTVF